MDTKLQDSDKLVYSKVVALTGRSGSGKSALSSFLEKLGAKVVSADSIAHNILDNQHDFKQELKLLFGPSIFDENYQIKKKELSELIFNDKKHTNAADNKNKLEKLIHPLIKKAAIEQFLKLSNDNDLIIYDVPLLFETDLWKEEFLAKVLIISDFAEERIVLRDKISKDRAKTRLSNQLDDASKINKVDFVVYNNGSLEELKIEAKKLYEKLQIIAKKEEF